MSMENRFVKNGPPLPTVPVFDTKVPEGSNFCTRGLWSVTYTFPDSSTASPTAPKNWPSAVPSVLDPQLSPEAAVQVSVLLVWLTPLPKLRMNVPLDENTCTL